MPFVAFLWAGDGSEGQPHGQQPQPAFDQAQARRQAATEPLPEAWVHQLGEVSVASAVGVQEQGDETSADDEARAEPQWLGEMQGRVICGAGTHDG